jgi:hypothetical protein
MADFELWARACETALWPAGAFTRAYAANRRTAIEAIIDADPVTTCVRQLVSERGSWAGSAADLLRVGERTRRTSDNTGWPKNPRALAGHLRRAQTFLRTVGIEITFNREGRAGNRSSGSDISRKYCQHRQQRPERRSRRWQRAKTPEVNMRCAANKLRCCLIGSLPVERSCGSRRAGSRFPQSFHDPNVSRFWVGSSAT